MALVSPTSEHDLQSYFEGAGRVAVVSGVNRSGMTRAVGELVGRLGQLRFPTLPRVETWEPRQGYVAETFAQALGSAVGLPDLAGKPAEIQKQLVEFATVKPLAPTLFLVGSLQKAPQDLQEFILRVAVASPTELPDTLVFMVEGAVDFRRVLRSAFPDGYPIDVPVFHTEPGTPWRHIVEVEGLVAALTRQEWPTSLVTWLSDLTAADIGFCREIIRRINPDSASAAALERVTEDVARSGPTAQRIREAAAKLDPSDLTALRAGRPIPAEHPEYAPSHPLKEAYLAGVLEYDRFLLGYRLRSPLVAAALSSDRETDKCPIARQAVYSRTTFSLWQVARVELVLRSLLAERTTIDRLSAVKCGTPWSGKAAEIKADLAGRLLELLPPTLHGTVMREVANCLHKILPNQTPAVSLREADPEAPGSEVHAKTELRNLIDRLTFGSVADLANSVALLSVRQREQLATVNKVRNSAAHFRAADFEDVHKLEREIPVLLSELVRKPL